MKQVPTVESMTGAVRGLSDSIDDLLDDEEMSAVEIQAAKAELVRQKRRAGRLLARGTTPAGE